MQSFYRLDYSPYILSNIYVQRLIFIDNCIRFTQIPLEASQGDEVVMTVPLHGHPSPAIEWFYDDKPIESTDNLDISEDSEVTRAIIPKVVPQDSGTYKCTVTSLKGTTTKKFLLVVEGM